jgi:hypothetical protein
MMRNHHAAARRVALAAVFVVVAASCSSASKAHTPASSAGHPGGAVATRTLTVHPVVYSAASRSGAAANVDVTMSPSPAGHLDVRVTGPAAAAHNIGAQWRAAAWDAIATTMLLSGDTLDGRRFTFKVDGPIDGTSASGLLTVAVLALLRGASLRNGVTMTGATTPDGTVDPVAGIAPKVAAAASIHAPVLLVPTGEGPSARDEPGVDVREVADISDAYRTLTGATLPAVGSTSPVDDGIDSQRLHAAVQQQVTRVLTDVKAVRALPVAIRDGLMPVVTQSLADAQRATAFERAHAYAGAFRVAREASTSADAAARAGIVLSTYLEAGFDAFAKQVQSERAAEVVEQRQQYTRLASFTPRSLADVSASLGAYGAAADAASTAAASEGMLRPVLRAKLAPTTSGALQGALEGVFLLELARGLLGYSHDVVSVAPAPGPTAPADVRAVDAQASAYEAAAQANVDAFGAIGPNAVSESSAIDALHQDLDYVLIATPQSVLAKALGTRVDERNAAYAQLGAAIARYVRSANLLEKYIAFQSQFDGNGDVTAVSDSTALGSALDSARVQTARALGALESERATPMLELGAYEEAGRPATASLEDRLTALAEYRSAFVTSRVLNLLSQAR